MRKALRERDGDACHWCGGDMIFPGTKGGPPRPRNLATIDHLTRKTDGGSDEITNLVLACHICNRKRDHAIVALPKEIRI